MRFFWVFLGGVMAGMMGVPGAVGAVTWHVNAEGTGDVPTILAAIDTAGAGDVIELACGTYHESTTLETMLCPKSDLTICSASGDPDCVTIDAQDPMGWGSVFYLADVSHVLFQGLTITGGNAVDVFLSSSGGGAYLHNCQNIRFEDCVFTGNRGRFGGALAVTGSELSLERCIITGNHALVAGGGTALTGQLEATECVILDNTAGHGLGPDAAIDGEATLCLLTCCEKDLLQWLVYAGSLVVEDEGCGTVGVERLPLGALKAIYR